MINEMITLAKQTGDEIRVVLINSDVHRVVLMLTWVHIVSSHQRCE